MTTPTAKSTEEAKRMEKEREQEQEAYKATCDKYISTGLRRNVTVQFLIDRLIKMGCTPPNGFIKCVDCGDKMAGGGFGVVEETIIEKKDEASSVAAAAASSSSSSSYPALGYRWYSTLSPWPWPYPPRPVCFC
mmetsp:Transcript_20084/g.40899  ORF Transcript_20084/g.40899 Transcript_20084/m.40899 type:complete len:134 (-) Transcript_20084:1441-1842(-)